MNIYINSPTSYQEIYGFISSWIESNKDMISVGSEKDEDLIIYSDFYDSEGISLIVGTVAHSAARIFAADVHIVDEYRPSLGLPDTDRTPNIDHFAVRDIYRTASLSLGDVLGPENNDVNRGSVLFWPTGTEADTKAYLSRSTPEKVILIVGSISETLANRLNERYIKDGNYTALIHLKVMSRINAYGAGALCDRLNIINEDVS